MERREFSGEECRRCGKTTAVRIVEGAEPDSEMLFISITSKCEDCGYEWGYLKWRTNIELEEESDS